jgi:CDP-diacylglycerol---serine O-phosphatidyltransferase
MENLADQSSIGKRTFRHQLKGSRYLIPNIVTVGGMFCGFLSIIYSTSGRFEKAAIAIAIGILLDGLDGKIARGLNATSRFGLEFDSLSDLIGFGVAPAILIYSWCFKLSADEFGVAVCFVYVVCAASRLARFNLAEPNSSNFQGLPSPASAGTIAAVVYFAPSSFSDGRIIALATTMMISLGLLMVSTFEFFSIKRIKLSSRSIGVPFVVAPLIGLIWWKAQVAFLFVAIAYCLSGPVLSLVRKITTK